MLRLLFTVAAVGLSHADDPVVAALRTPAKVEMLPNGLTLVVAEDHRAPLLASVVLLGSGAGDEDPARSGIAHLFEHLMYEGTPRVPGQGYDLALSAAGGDNNAWTDHDATVFHAVVPVGAVNRLLFLEADRLANLPAGLTEDSLENQLAIVQAEASLTDETPHARDLDALLAAIYGPAHPYGAPVHGDPERRNRLTLSEAQAWGERVSRPAGVTVVLVGALEQQALLALARSAFGGLPARVPGEQTAAALPAPRVGRWSFAGSTRKDTLYVAWPLDPASVEEQAAATMLARGLVGNGQGPLAKALPRHGVDAWTWRGQQGALFVVQVQGHGPLDRTEAQLVAAWPAAVASAVSDPARLAREQRVLRLDRIRAFEDPLARAESLALCVAQGRSPGCEADALAQALAVTPLSLARFARTLPLETATVLGTADTRAHRLSAPELLLWP